MSNFCKSYPNPIDGSVVVGKVPAGENNWDTEFPTIKCIDENQANDFIRLLNFAYQAGRDDRWQDFLYGH